MSLRPAAKLYQHRGHNLTTPPASEPVTADELRTHLREISANLGDAEANSYITSARQFIEMATGLALITQTWTLTYDHWPAVREQWWNGVRQGAIGDMLSPQAGAWVALPRYPLQSVSSVTVYGTDGSGTSVTVANVFDVDTAQRPGRMALKYGQTWPVALRPTNAVVIAYVAGYGSASDVPEILKLAVKSMAAHLYSHRGDGCSVTDAYRDSGAKAMADQYAAARL